MTRYFTACSLLYECVFTQTVEDETNSEGKLHSAALKLVVTSV